VYVTGSSVQILPVDTGADYTTIKYSASGSELWMRLYNGPGNGNDVASALALDGAGNVYVTGGSAGAGTGSDYATIKYSASGVRLWVQRYDGPGNGSDSATAVAVDASGNVYVTGGSSGDADDYATLKYAASGDELWVARYDGPGNRRDVATALALDRAGNVYVTGTSFGSSTDDYATLKYTASGDELWVGRYNGSGSGDDSAAAVAVDACGNVYVTGQSGGSYATIKYDADGNPLWVTRFGNGVARALVVDSSGNVYVTGSSAASGASANYATVKYDTDGNQLWVARYNGPGNGEDNARALALDASGNVYVTGESDGVPGLTVNYDYATVKYDAEGNEVWVARYNGPGNSSDSATALALDGSGNVYVTGSSVGIGTGSDYATIQYDTGGNELWIARYNGTDNRGESARPLALDASGNVYVTGSSVGSDTGSDYATIKYSAELPRPVLDHRGQSG
jgi:predicted house-cleaning NTP pyrophosphatase (Maf/HAM1 superfamily)